MVDPISTGLAIYKWGSVAGKVKGVLQKFAHRRTEEFIQQRDEMHREWTAETARNLAEHIEESRQAFLLIGGLVEEHDAKLEETLGTPEAEVLAALYGEAAYREALDERRMMLQHAAASIADLEIPMAEKCRAEKVLRDLDPSDVIELDCLERIAGTVERLEDGKGRHNHNEERHRYRRLMASRSTDALLSSGCVRVMGGTFGGDVAVVTARGRVMLHLLRSYTASHRAPASGRETVPGERGEDAARSILGAAFRSASLKTAGIVRAGRRDLSKPPHQRAYRIQFDFPKPSLDAQVKDPQPIREPEPHTLARIHIWPCPDDVAAELVAAKPQELRVSTAPADKAGFANIIVEGPFDVLRWLADDLDAWWT